MRRYKSWSSGAGRCTVPLYIREDFLLAKKILKKCGQAKLMRELEKCNRVLLSYKRECEKYVIYESIGNFAFELMNVRRISMNFYRKHRSSRSGKI